MGRSLADNQGHASRVRGHGVGTVFVAGGGKEGKQEGRESGRKERRGGKSFFSLWTENERPD